MSGIQAFSITLKSSATLTASNLTHSGISSATSPLLVVNASLEPVIANLVIGTGGGTRQVFTNVDQAYRYVHLQNAVPGLKYAYIIVNGNVFAVNPLWDGDDLILDVAAALLPGKVNKIALEGYGKSGSSLLVTISDVIPGALALGRITTGGFVADYANQLTEEDIQVPILLVLHDESGVSLAWPTSGSNYQALGCQTLSTEELGRPAGGAR